MTKKKRLIVGIDFGTTFSKIARVMEDGQVEVVRNNGKDLQIPTVIFLGENGEEYGHRANNLSITDPDRLMMEFKRHLGETDGEGNPLVIYVDPKTNREYSVVDLVSLFLKNLKETVEKELSASVGGVVISVPAYFQDLARRQLMEGAKQAGLKVLGLIDEPVAASMAYAVDGEKKGKYLVYDLGGGTFDVTLVEVDETGLRVKATDGDSQLGGCDFNLQLLQDVLKKFSSEQDFAPDPVDDLRDLHELSLKVNQARHDLSESETATVNVRIRAGQMLYEISRNEFSKLVHETVEETIGIANRCLKKSKIKPKELDAVLLVGGSTHMPCIQNRVEKEFGVPVMAAPDREFLVARGASFYAVQLGSKDKELASQVKELPIPDLVITNKTAHPLCISIVDPDDESKRRSLHHCMIPEQSDIPAERTDHFSPAADNQTGVKVDITQGKPGSPVKSEEIIHSVDLVTKPLPRDQRTDSIEVTYRFDEDSIIHVRAKDLITGEVSEGKCSVKI